MGESKQVAIPNSSPENPFLQIQSKLKEFEIGFECWISKQPVGKIYSKWKELENGFECWVSKQPLYVEAAISTARGAAQGALIGAILSPFRQASASASASPPPQLRMSDVMLGVFDTTFSTLAKISRRKDDANSAYMLEGFRFAVMLPWVFGNCRDQELTQIRLLNSVNLGVLYIIFLKMIHHQSYHLDFKDGMLD